MQPPTLQEGEERVTGGVRGSMVGFESGRGARRLIGTDEVNWCMRSKVY